MDPPLVTCLLCAARDTVCRRLTHEAIASLILDACAHLGVEVVLAGLCAHHAGAHRYACDRAEQAQKAERS
ncbi:MAG TPA: hypothetical protein VGY54_21080 [Polyangiaceae bacterium]|jgi:hypothetical protein|nr:hypothetical protein [Polyangiaceae bacterium]